MKVCLEFTLFSNKRWTSLVPVEAMKSCYFMEPLRKTVKRLITKALTEVTVGKEVS